MNYSREYLLDLVAKQKKPDYYARIIGYEKIAYENQGYWNCDKTGYLFVDEPWELGYSHRTIAQWNHLGINTSNAVFQPKKD